MQRFRGRKKDAKEDAAEGPPPAAVEDPARKEKKEKKDDKKERKEKKEKKDKGEKKDPNHRSLRRSQTTSSPSGRPSTDPSLGSAAGPPGHFNTMQGERPPASPAADLQKSYVTMSSASPSSTRAGRGNSLLQSSPVVTPATSGELTPVSSPSPVIQGAAAKAPLVMSEYTIPLAVGDKGSVGADGRMVIDEYAIPDVPASGSDGAERQLTPEAKLEREWVQVGGGPEGIVPLNYFMVQLSQRCSSEIPEPLKAIMYELLGEHVPKDRYLALARLFGADALVEQLRKLCAQVWFYNLISDGDVQRFLAGENPTCYMVRFSDDTLQRLDFNYVRDGEVKAVQITPAFPQPGLHVRRADGAAQHVQGRALEDVVADLASELGVTPFQSNVADELWFHGGISADEATELLRTQPAGTFLVRFSRQANSYTISQIVEDRQFISVAHTRLNMTPDNWFADVNTGKKWPSLENFIQLANMRTPLPSPYGQMRKMGVNLRLLAENPDALKGMSIGMGGTASPGQPLAMNGAPAMGGGSGPYASAGAGGANYVTGAASVGAPRMAQPGANYVTGGHMAMSGMMGPMGHPMSGASYVTGSHMMSQPAGNVYVTGSHMAMQGQGNAYITGHGFPQSNYAGGGANYVTGGANYVTGGGFAGGGMPQQNIYVTGGAALMQQQQQQPQQPQGPIFID